MPEISVYDISADNAADAEVPNRRSSSEVDGQFTKVWKMAIPQQTVWRVSYSGKGGGMLDIRGHRGQQEDGGGSRCLKRNSTNGR